MLKLKPQYWCEVLIYWKRPWCWETLKARGEGDDRGWDGLMASLTRWTWVWVSSGSWWWTGKADVLQSMGSQSFRHDWTTELNWAILFSKGSSPPKDQTRVSCIAGRFFTIWATRKTPKLIYGSSKFLQNSRENQHMDDIWLLEMLNTTKRKKA